MLLRSTNNREENSPAAIFRDRHPCCCAAPTTGKKIRLRRFFGIDCSDHHQLMNNPLGRDRMLRRGEFGAAVFEKRRSIRSRRAEKEFFGIGVSSQKQIFDEVDADDLSTLGLGMIHIL
ncbi:MAG: hypothetical protein ACYCYO_11140 [Bacilli bacterium]